MVWLAPAARSSGGRSAVSSSKGTESIAASTTAGSRLATAVPEVVMTAAGRPVARAWPSAKKPAPRSSKCTCAFSAARRATASASGAEREPGAMQKQSTPFRSSSSMSSSAASTLRLGAFQCIGDARFYGTILCGSLNKSLHPVRKKSVGSNGQDRAETVPPGGFPVEGEQGFSWHQAPRRRRARNPASLCSTSSHSAAGSESRTMPAPV